MPLPPHAATPLVIGGVTLPTDPGLYQFRFPKHWSGHHVQGPDFVLQDFGSSARAGTIRAGSGPTPPRQFPQLIDSTTVTALFALKAATGATYGLSDWLGTNFQVALVEFDADYFTADLWTYDMLLQIR